MIASKLFHPRKHRTLSSESEKRKEKYLLQAISLARVEAEKVFYFGLAFFSAVVRNNYCKYGDYNPRIGWTFLTICCVTSTTEETVKRTWSLPKILYPTVVRKSKCAQPQ